MRRVITWIVALLMVTWIPSFAVEKINQNDFLEYDYYELYAQTINRLMPLSTIFDRKSNLVQNGDFQSGIYQWNSFNSNAKAVTLDKLVWIDDKNEVEIPNLKNYKQLKSADPARTSFKINKNESGNLLITTKIGNFNAYEINTRNESMLSLARADSGHYWVHQRLEDMKIGNYFIFSYDTSSPYSALGEVFLGTYDKPDSILYQQEEAGPKWDKKIHIGIIDRDTLDIILYNYDRNPLMYDNVELFSFTREEMVNYFGEDFSQYNYKDTRRIIDEMQSNQFRDHKMKMVDNKKHIDEKYNQLFYGKLRSMVNGIITQKESVFKENLKRLIIDDLKANAGILSEIAYEDSDQLVQLYLNNLVHFDMDNSVANFTKRSYLANMRLYKAECSRMASYLGEIIKIVTDDSAYYTFAYGHTFISTDKLILDPNYNTAILANVYQVELVRNLSKIEKNNWYDKNVVMGPFSLLLNFSTRVSNYTDPQIVEKDYKGVKEKYNNVNDKFPIMRTNFSIAGF